MFGWPNLKGYLDVEGLFLSFFYSAEGKWRGRVIGHGMLSCFDLKHLYSKQNYHWRLLI